MVGDQKAGFFHFLEERIEMDKITKNKRRCLIPLGILICILFMTIDVLAKDTGAMLPEESFTVGIVTESFDYSEPDIDMSIDGLMYGLAGDYTYHDFSRLMLSANFTLSLGQLDYDGHTWSGIPVKEDTDDLIFEFCGQAGYTWTFNNGDRIIPYIGLGYRYWNDEIGDSGGYGREIQYIYLPVRIRIKSDLVAGWTWGAVLMTLKMTRIPAMDTAS